MVYVVEVKPGLWYAYKCVRLPGHKHPVKQYIGPASKVMIKAERRRRAEAASRKQGVCSPTDANLDSNGSISELDYKREGEQ